MARNSRVNKPLERYRKFTTKTIKGITLFSVNRLERVRTPPEFEYAVIVNETSYYSCHFGYEQKSLLKFAEKLHPDKCLYLFSVNDFEKLVGEDFCRSATHLMGRTHQTQISVPETLNQVDYCLVSHQGDSKLEPIPPKRHRTSFLRKYLPQINLGSVPVLIILATVLTLGIAKEAKATSFDGRVYPSKNGTNSTNMPITLIQKRTGFSENRRVDANHEWGIGPSSLTWLAGDTAKVIVQDTTNNEKDSTFMRCPSNGVGGWLPTLCLGGWGTQIKEVKNSPNDSAYAEIFTATDTLYNKFEVRLPFAPQFSRYYSLCFDLSSMNPIPTPGDSATIKVRADSFVGSVTGTLSHGRWDADVLAESLNLVPSQGFRDVSITRTASQTLDDTVDVGSSHQRNTSIKNNSGLRREKVDVIYTRKRNGVKLDSTATLQVPLEPPHFYPDTAFLGFSNWNVALQDTGLNVITYKITPTDSAPENNTKAETTFVRARDVGATQILAPTGQIYTNVSVTPKAIIENFGNVITDSFKTYISIYEDASPPIYMDSIKTCLAPGKKDTVEFREVSFSNPMNPGRVKAWTVWSHDINPSNDSSPEGSFDVSAPPTGWSCNDLENILAKVKDGGAITATENAFYAFTGGNTRLFCKFTPGTDKSQGTWTSLESIPYATRPEPGKTTITKRKVGKGATLCYAGNNIIYATKSKELWKYNTNNGTWVLDTFVPIKQAPGGGTSMVFLNGKIYMLIGNAKKDSFNFWSYDIASKNWAKLDTAPLFNSLDLTLRTYKDGSCLAILDDDTICVMKGGDSKRNGFYKYSISQNKWTNYLDDTIPRLNPRNGKKTIIKNGGAMIGNPLQRLIYLIKGGSQDFWVYNADSPWPKWTALDTLPKYTSRKTPAGGSAMAFFQNTVRVLKGGTQEFWKYVPSTEMSNVKAQMSKVTQNVITSQSEVISNRIPMFTITPNPFTKQTMIRYTVPIAGKVSLKLYNTTGRLVDVLNDGYLTAGTYTTNLTTNNFAKGIYFLRYNDTHNQKELKLIVE